MFPLTAATNNVEVLPLTSEHLKLLEKEIKQNTSRMQMLQSTTG